MGYRAFSSFLASDDDAFVIRKFGTLHVRTILMLQDEIVGLEDQLAAIDQRCEEQQVDDRDDYLFHNGSFRGDRLWHKDRYEVMHRLVNLLDQYDRLVLNYNQIKKQPKAPQRALANIKRWFETYPQAITEYEMGFLSSEKEADLAATAERPKAPLRRILENIRWFRHSRPFRLDPQKYNEYLLNYSKEDVIYYDDDKIDIAINGIILFIGLVMLLVPAWLLNAVSSYTTRLAMITGFIAAFLGLLLLVTPTKPFETMVGTAAYGALLMVFMQIGK
ncbi:hypothetical protein BKCO1_3000201 [Neofusicoccum parvum]|uniref:Uncharacterized protein n=1 Tax=Neofusicoccum parvum TaxID=310453 RepID=A0ACB5S158_9PEZI|nr:hypothetical protein BKCO1_3000201 [Neofusicoccum parvum]GME65613.1 hypothetical protein BKCO1_3000201 [Neofusicoccum parvum]